MLCIKNGRIHDAVHREPYTADILIENGKLLQIGTDLHAEQTIDAAGLEIYPGFVDAHSHIGLDGHQDGRNAHRRHDRQKGSRDEMRVRREPEALLRLQV